MKNRKKIVLICLIVLMAIVFGIGIYYVIDSHIGGSQENPNNGGESPGIKEEGGFDIWT